MSLLLARSLTRSPTAVCPPPPPPSSLSLSTRVGAPMASPTEPLSILCTLPWPCVVALGICWSSRRMSEQLRQLVQNWNFTRGQNFEQLIFHKLRSLVHHPSSSPRGAFHLLAVFQRYTFRLSEESVSLALHSVLGGTPVGFHVTCIQDRHFRFSVASRHVGFMIRDLSQVTTGQFDVYFHLWRDGGVDWFREWSKWKQEEDASWQRVEHRKCKSPATKHVSFASKLVQDSPKSKSIPSEVKSSVMFATLARLALLKLFLI
jgi:hypothetical protein